MKRLNTWEWVALVLIIVGALNWGLIGLFGYNLVEVIFGLNTLATKLVYVLVGLAGAYELYVLVRNRRDV